MANKKHRNNKKFINKIKFLQLNTNTTRAGNIKISNLLHNESFDFALIQEPHVRNNTIQLLGRNVIFDENSKKPRTAIAFSNSFKFNLFKINSLCNQDCTAAKITKIKDKNGHELKILIASIYIPCTNDNSIDLNNLDKVVAYAESNKLKLLICTDANSHNTIWHNDYTDLKGETLAEFIYSKNLFIHNKKSKTLIRSNCETSIDLTLSNFEFSQYITDWKTNPDLCLCSDHVPIEFNLKLSKPPKMRFRNIKKINWNSFLTNFSNSINRVDISSIENSSQLEAIADQIEEIYENSFKSSCPLVKQKFIPSKAFYDSDCHKASRRLKAAFKKWFKHRFDPNKSIELNVNYKKAHSEYQKLIRKKSNDCFKNFASEVEKTEKAARLTNCKKNYNLKCLTSLTYKDKISNDPDESIKMLAEAHFENAQFNNIFFPIKIFRSDFTEDEEEFIFNLVSTEKIEQAINSFSPYKKCGFDGIYPIMLQKTSHLISPMLQKIFKICLLNSYIPKNWMRIKVIFLPKPGKDECDPKSYRGISLMSFILKLLEKLIANYLEPIVLGLEYNQYAYKTDRSTVQALHDVTSFIEKKWKKKQYVWGGFFDISKAFDGVRFDVVKDALQKYNVNGTTVNIIMFLLEHRIITIDHFNNNLTLKGTCGTPQGGVLSCLIWNITANSLIEKLKESLPNSSIHFYSDDLVILIANRNEELLSATFGKALKLLQEWCTEKGLSVNPEKCSYLRFTTKQNIFIPDSNLKLYGKQISFTDQTTYLGVVLDNKLTFFKHFEFLTEKANNYLWSLKRYVGKLYGFNLKISMWCYHSILLPKIFYASCIWFHRLKLKTYKLKLDKIHSKALKMISSSMNTTPTIAIEKLLNILPIYENLKIYTTLEILRLCKLNQWNNKIKDFHHKSYDLLNIDNLIDKYDYTKSTKIDHNSSYIIPSRSDWNSGFNLNADINCFVDASVMEHRTGIGIYCEELNYFCSGMAYTNMSSYKAELIAVNTVLTKLINDAITSNIVNKSIAIFTDNMGVVQSLKNNYSNSHNITMTHKKLEMLKKYNNSISIVWIPSHQANTNTFFLRNNKADELTRDIKAKLNFNIISAKLSRKELKHKMIQEAYIESDTFPPNGYENLRKFKCFKYYGEKLHNFSRKNFSALLYLFTGQNCLRYHMNKVKRNTIDTSCRFCLEDDETSTHLICFCEAFKQERKLIFGSEFTDLTNYSAENILLMCKKFIKITNITEPLLKYTEN